MKKESLFIPNKRVMHYAPKKNKQKKNFFLFPLFPSPPPPPPHPFLQRQAILDKSFSSMFTCPPPSSSSFSLPSLLGTLRAMCRVCHNISNPANGLVLNGTFTCFPPEIVETLESKCLPPGFSLSDLEECRAAKSGNSYVRAHYNYTKTETGAGTLRFLAMAFRSVSSWDR